MYNFYKDNFFSSQQILRSSTDIDDDDNEEEEFKPIRTKLYVTNFPQNCTRRQLTEFFCKFGNVLECAIMWDTYAFVHYGSRKEASYALKKASGRLFMGNKLFIQLSTSKHRQEANWYQKEVEKLQTQLFSIQNSLDSLNVQDDENSATLISSISSNSLNNINETKLYVTNLPDNCNHNELKNLFQKYGNVLECVVMWNHYAFIHYSNSNEARNGLVNLHGYLFCGKNLIVQFSTSSNRPLPKCKVFNSNENMIQQLDKVNKDKTNKNKQNGLEFIKNFEKLVNQVESKETTPATILCYRASDLENELGLSQNQTLNNNINLEKDWIKILSTNLIDNYNNKNEEIVSLSEIPIPDTGKLTTKMPFISSKQNNSDVPRLDQIPTPPLPNQILTSFNGNSTTNCIDNSCCSSSSNITNIKNINKKTSSDSSSSSSADISDYPISSSNSVSPYTLSLDDDTEDIFENNNLNVDLINFNDNDRKSEIENYNLMKKYSRSRCLLVNTILFPGLKEKFYLN